MKKRIMSLLLTIVMLIGLIPAGVLTVEAVNVYEASGTVYAGQIPVGSEIVLRDDTTLIMNVERWFRTISGPEDDLYGYDLTVKGPESLTIGQEGSVYGYILTDDFICSTGLTVFSGNDYFAVGAAGSVNIDTGDDSLYIDCYCGIFATGGDVWIRSYSVYIDTVYGSPIASDIGSVYVNAESEAYLLCNKEENNYGDGPTVAQIGCAVYADDDAILNCGLLRIKGTYGIYSKNGNAEVTSENVRIHAEKCGVYAINGNAEFDVFGTSYTNLEIYSNGIGIEADWVYIDTVFATVEAYEYGIVAYDGGVTVSADYFSVYSEGYACIASLRKSVYLNCDQIQLYADNETIPSRCVYAYDGMNILCESATVISSSEHPDAVCLAADYRTINIQGEIYVSSYCPVASLPAGGIVALAGTVLNLECVSEAEDPLFRAAYIHMSYTDITAYTGGPVMDAVRSDECSLDENCTIELYNVSAYFETDRTAIYADNDIELVDSSIYINSSGDYGIKSVYGDITVDGGYLNTYGTICGVYGRSFDVMNADYVYPEDAYFKNGMVYNSYTGRVATTVETSQPIGDIDLIVPTPMAGDTPADADRVYGAPAGSYVYSVTWYDTLYDREMYENETFAPDREYTAEIVLKTAYRSFPNNIAVTVNGKSCGLGWSDNNKTLRVTAEKFGKTFTKVESVALNIAEPVEGETVSYNVTFDSVGAAVAGTSSNRYENIKWFELTEEGEREMEPGDVFVGGNYYAVVVRLKPYSTKYRFAVEYNNLGNALCAAEATVNGDEVYYVDGDENELYFCHIFGICPDEMIEEVVITDVTEPVAGQKPVYRATAGEGSYESGIRFTVTDKNEYKTVGNEKVYYIKNGIGWYDYTANRWMYENETFIEGHQYRVCVYIETYGDCSFHHSKYNVVESFTAYVNGKDAYYDPNGIYTQEIEYVFTAKPKPKYAPGDINLDGQVNSIDSNLLKRIIASAYTVESGSDSAIAADFNGDGAVNSIDSNLLKRKVAGQ